LYDSFRLILLLQIMRDFLHTKPGIRWQYFYSVLIVITVSLLCYGLSHYLGYRVIALILLLAVSIIAISFEILPVLLAAALSAFIWDFFFIPPHFTIHVASTEDAILLIMYFIIAMVNAVLTYRIRKIEKLARLRQERAKAIKLYNTLLNSLSHELRTPIATIIGATDNLQENNQNLTENNKQQLLAEIAKASFRLNQQVENLLNMSRIESGFLQPKRNWCDVGEIIYAVVKRVEEDGSLQPIKIDVPSQLPFFRLDKGMLEQVLFNLLSNAVRYTPADSMIRLAASFDQSLFIKVEDNGKGLPEQKIPFVFDKFYRLKNTTVGGTGLGLSIVKGFTEAMGGTVQVHNKPGGGAIFTVELPAEISSIKKSADE
jgi:two-component system, OmpR family, sensor histidine kinase KdpD